MRPVVIAAGGTGGHMFPAEALAAELVARGRRIVLMTDSRSPSLQSPVFAGKEQYVLRGAGADFSDSISIRVHDARLY